MGFDDGCNTGLMLGLGIASPVEKAKNIVNPQQQHLTPKAASFEPSLSLALPGETYPQASAAGNGKQGNGTADVNRKRGHESAGVVGDRYYQVLSNNDYSRRDDQDSPHRDHNNSAISNSFSSGTRVVKRERDLSSEEIEGERVISSTSRASDEDEDGVNARKKLRLTKEQSALLEECFKHHSTLNPKQKQALARQLNLRPRQVEVWFQNRRARTKLKQTEVDCEFLKKCCETLTDENRRLQKELQELKALKLAQPLYMHMPAATLTMCPSCERVADGNSKGPFPMATKPHCYVPFTNPSAAC